MCSSDLEKNPQRRDAYLQKNRINPDQFKPHGRSRKNGSPGDPSGGSSGTSGCFLTSACVRARNLSDDCDELKTLREFRDSFMMSTVQGRSEVEHYYAIAPAIVESIDKLPNATEIWNKLFADTILPAVTLIKENNVDAAYQLYKNCVLELQFRFLHHTYN